MLRRTRRERDTGRRPPTPPTPKVVSKPPTPTVTKRETRAERERRLWRAQTKRTGTATAMDQPLISELGATPLERSWRAFQKPWQILGEQGKGVVESLFPGTDVYGGQTGDWRKILAGIQQGLQPYGFGYGPTWGQPGGLLGGPEEQARKTAAELAAEYGGEPTELWFLREDLGGRAGRAGEIWKAWAAGGRPLFVPKSAAEILAVTEEQMREAGYGRTLGGSWQLEDIPRPDLQPPPSYGGSYGYTPSRYGYGGGGGGVRGQAAARGAGLVNWRIRIG